MITIHLSSNQATMDGWSSWACLRLKRGIPCRLSISLLSSNSTLQTVQSKQYFVRSFTWPAGDGLGYFPSLKLPCTWGFIREASCPRVSMFLLLLIALMVTKSIMQTYVDNICTLVNYEFSRETRLPVVKSSTVAPCPRRSIPKVWILQSHDFPQWL
jgi:hypothetical protein